MKTKLRLLDSKRMRDRMDFGVQIERYEIPSGVDEYTGVVRTILAYITKTRRGTYKCWYNGCGIGGESRSIAKARGHVKDYVMANVQRKVSFHEASLGKLSWSRFAIRTSEDLRKHFGVEVPR